MLIYDLKVGYSCNNRCQHCVIEDSKDKLINKKINYNLTTEECCQRIDTACVQGVSTIILTGGEITIRSDFDKIIKKCVNKNLNISIQTNGRLLNSQKIVSVIKDIDNIKFIIALHGSNEETHDNITMVNGSFQETCIGIKTMTNLNKLVILKVVISKINQHELPGIVALGNSFGVEYINFAFPHGQGAARKNFDKIIPTYSSLKKDLERTIELSEKLNIQIEFEAIPFCIIPNHLKLVGELRYSQNKTICTQVKEDTFEWNEVRKSIKQKGTNCKKCYFDYLCEGPWNEYIDFFGDKEFKPIITDQ